MSDFLGQIIARSLNQTPAVRPRLPSLFEPIHGAVAPAWMETPAATPAAGQRGVTPDLQPTPLAAEPARPQTEITRGLAAQRNAPPIQASTLSSPFPPQLQQPAFAPLEPTTRAERDANLAALQVDRPVARASEVVPGKPPPLGNEAHYVGPLTPPSSPPLTNPRVDPAGSTSSVPAPRLGPRPRHPALEAAGPLQPVQRTIHVTIGRVEVRAMLPQQKPVRVESPAPARRSLEEYLKRRNGGRS